MSQATFKQVFAVLSCAVALALGSLPAGAAQGNIESRVEHGYADAQGVKIHYATLGDRSKPMLLMIHGFPDYWYSWREQMEALSDEYFCVAMDQRGYNLSGQPKGSENYDAGLLIGDVAAVIKHLGRDKATLIGHDWGGLVAWIAALYMPHLVDRLIVLNLPHPRGIARELASNPLQQKNTAYARAFQQPGAAQTITPEQLGAWVREFSGTEQTAASLVPAVDSVVDSAARPRQTRLAEQLASWVKSPADRARYVEAFERSDFAAMLSYYERNFPRQPYLPDSSAVVKLKMPVLMIHGLQDPALRAEALDRSWEWLEQDLTLVTLPKAGHFVQQDEAEMVSRSIRMWLGR